MTDGARDRARSAIATAGLDPEAPLERAESNANDAWLGPTFVLRVNHRGDIGRLALASDYRELLSVFEGVYASWFGHPRALERLAILHLSRTLGHLHETPPQAGRDTRDPRDRRNHMAAGVLRAMTFRLREQLKSNWLDLAPSDFMRFSRRRSATAWRAPESTVAPCRCLDLRVPG